MTAIHPWNLTHFRLFCFVPGGTLNNVFQVEIEREETVYALKKAIKVQTSVAFRDLAASSLFLWKVSVPFDNLEEDVRKLNLEYDNALLPNKILSDVFDSTPSRHCLHIIVVPPPSPSQLDLPYDPAEKAHDKVIRDAAAAPAPSSVSNSATVYIFEQEERPIYNGRPVNRSGPPLSIYHGVFAQLKDALQNPDKMVDPQEENRVADTGKLCRASAEIYRHEQDRIEAVYPFINTLLGVQLSTHVDVGESKADGLVLQPIDEVVFDNTNGVVARVEVKNDMETSGDCKLQNDLSLRKRLTLPMHKKIYRLTCCPCITVSIAGPYISFGGAIFVDAFVTESFTELIYLGGTNEEVVTLSRIFAAVARGIEGLKKFYRDLKLPIRPARDQSRLFPQPTYFSNKRPPFPTPVLYRRFLQHEANYGKSLFEATYNDKTVLVKFCESYHERAHRILADAKYAPELFFCEKIQGGMTMVIMKLVNCEDAHYHYLAKNLPDDILKEIKVAVNLLHDEDLVFGDLRRPNILIKDPRHSPRVLLIDFDWAGTHGEARYSPFLNDFGEIVWANGVHPYGLMEKKHDLEMISLLNFSPPKMFRY